MVTEFDKVVKVAAPAAGQNFSVSVPAGVTWELCHLSFLFTASASAATRSITVAVQDADNGFELGAQTTGSTVTANNNQVAQFSDDWGAGTPAATTADRVRAWVAMPCATFQLPPATKVVSIINNIQAGDTITQIELLVKERPLVPGNGV